MDKRHVFAVMLMAVLLLFLPGMVSYAAAGETSAAYQEAAWNGGRVTYTAKTAENCRPVTGSTAEVTWNPGWYVVNGSVTISEPVTVSGAVNLILAEGCNLNAEKGIVVTDGNSLTIYAQSGGSGTLTAIGTADDSRNASAGIGGSTVSFDSGAITIHGGVINATGGGTGSAGYGGAGIGGGILRSGNGGSSGKVTIYGGTVKANSGAGEITGAGIGGGGGHVGGAGNDITIYGGSVTAVSTGTGIGGAGIGGGGGGEGGGIGENINIYGGTVNAIGSTKGAGIGGGGSGTNLDQSRYKSGDGSGITINGGIVTAVGGQYAAGIGGGGGYYYSSSHGGTTFSGGCTGGIGSVTISGGIVDVKGGAGNNSGEYKGAPIGNGGNTTGTAGVTKTAGIIFENTVGTVYGTVTVDGTYTIPAGYSLTIAKGGKFNGNYAIYQDGRPIELEAVKTAPVAGPATVKKCGHEGAKPASNGGGTHTLDCPYCGYVGEQNCAVSQDGPVLYTGEGEKAPTCTEEGLGHRECVCGSVMESGVVVKALGHE